MGEHLILMSYLSVEYETIPVAGYESLVLMNENREKLLAWLCQEAISTYQHL